MRAQEASANKTLRMARSPESPKYFISLIGTSNKKGNSIRSCDLPDLEVTSSEIRYTTSVAFESRLYRAGDRKANNILEVSQVKAFYKRERMDTRVGE